VPVTNSREQQLLIAAGSLLKAEAFGKVAEAPAKAVEVSEERTGACHQFREQQLLIAAGSLLKAEAFGKVAEAPMKAAEAPAKAEGASGKAAEAPAKTAEGAHRCLSPIRSVKKKACLAPDRTESRRRKTVEGRGETVGGPTSIQTQKV
jgi:hypothetical protein